MRTGLRRIWKEENWNRRNALSKDFLLTYAYRPREQHDNAQCITNIYFCRKNPRLQYQMVCSRLKNGLFKIDPQTQNYWVLGLCPSSGILETRKHNFSEIGSASVLRWGGWETPTMIQWLRLALSKGPNRVGVFQHPHLRTVTNPVSETLCFLVSRTPDDGHNPKTQ
jgi:hypothetical protein